MGLWSLFIRVWTRLFWISAYVVTPTAGTGLTGSQREKDTDKRKNSGKTESGGAGRDPNKADDSDPPIKTDNTLIPGGQLGVAMGTATGTIPRGPRPAVTPDEEDPRTSWVYRLSKEDLITGLTQYHLDIHGTVEEMRGRLTRFWKEGIKRGTTTPLLQAQDTQWAFGDPPEGVTLDTSQDGAPGGSDAAALLRVKEILGLPPQASSESMYRALAGHSRGRAAGHGFNGGVTPGPQTGYALLPGLPPHQTGPTHQQTVQRDDYFDDGRQDARGTPQICNLVRKWNVRFDGHKDPISFLERLEELQEAYAIAPRDLMKAMPELLTGSALLWYRNVRDDCETFEEFRENFEQQFLPPGYRSDLDEEIRRRTQGGQETFKSFVVAISTLMRRRGGYNLKDKLDIIYRNTQPEYKLSLRRADFDTLGAMLRHADHVESCRRDRATFVAPPTPKMSLVPETAYKADKAWPEIAAVLPPRRLDEPTGERQVVRKGGAANNEAAKGIQREKANAQHYPTSRHRTPGRSTLPKDEGCWRCGQQGHFARECGIQRDIHCYRCKTRGVTARNCKCSQGNGHWAQERAGRLSPHTPPNRPPSDVEGRRRDEGRATQ